MSTTVSKVFEGKSSLSTSICCSRTSSFMPRDSPLADACLFGRYRGRLVDTESVWLLRSSFELIHTSFGRYIVRLAFTKLVWSLHSYFFLFRAGNSFSRYILVILAGTWLDWWRHGSLGCLQVFFGCYFVRLVVTKPFWLLNGLLHRDRTRLIVIHLVRPIDM